MTGAPRAYATPIDPIDLLVLYDFRITYEKSGGYQHFPIRLFLRTQREMDLDARGRLQTLQKAKSSPPKRGDRQFTPIKLVIVDSEYNLPLTLRLKGG
eukprot:SAG31_NODE_3126_length_4646_cov_6.852210_5_plen_98_part_00